MRVTAIYEGTNGIQAMDLGGRKMMDNGEAAFRLIEEIEQNAHGVRGQYPNMATAVWDAAECLREATEWLVAQEMNDRFAGAVPYLRANLPPAEFELLSQLVMELGRRCKAGAFPMVTADLVALAVEQSDDLLPATRALAPSFLRSQVDGGGLDFPSSAALGNDGEPEDHGAAQPVDRPRQRED